MHKITEQEIVDFQNKWASGVIEIGKLYTEGKDPMVPAQQFVKRMYGYGETTVLFKPTRAISKVFRLSEEGAISYFVGNNPRFPEDSGFALQPWKSIRFENAGLILNPDNAVAMGHYFMTDTQNNTFEIEYTIGVYRNGNGELKINIHHSSFPYNPQ